MRTLPSATTAASLPSSRGATLLARLGATTRAARCTTIATTSGNSEPAIRRSATTSGPRPGSCRGSATSSPRSGSRSHRSRRRFRGSVALRRTCSSSAFTDSTASCKARSTTTTLKCRPRTDGHFNRWSFDSGLRAGARFQTTIGYLRNNISLPYGDFSTDLLRVKSTYSFTTRVLVQALVQYNTQTALATSNIRFAWLDRSGTGLFVGYNDTRDTFGAVLLPGVEQREGAVLGRSFVVKYTKLISF
jgi:hypothetical protein